MGDVANVSEKSSAKSWFKGLKSEFKKIIWPDKETLGKQTLAVIIITIVLGLVIALLDLAIKYGIDLII